MNVLPHSQEAEEYIIASILINPNLKHDVSLRIRASDFFMEDNKTIFKAIMALDFIDLVQVCEYFTSRKVSFDPYEKLANMMSKVSTTQGIQHSVRLVKEKSVYRHMINACEEVNDLIDSGKTTLETIKGEVFQKFDIETELTQESETMEDHVNDFNAIMKLRKEHQGSQIKYGIPWADKKTLGMHPGQLILIAARPSVGKSTLAIQIAKGNVDHGKNVLFFSLEMTSVSFIEKIVSNAVGVDSYKLKEPQLLRTEEIKQIHICTKEIKTLPLIIIDKIFNLEHIISKTRQIHSRKKIDLIIIDHLHLVSTVQKTSNANEKITYISRSVKLLAKELNIPIIALCQLKRQEGKNPVPILTDLRESGSLEQDADVVMFLHDESAGEYTTESRPIVELKLIIAKQREGERDVSINLGYNKPLQRMDERIYGNT